MVIVPPTVKLLFNETLLLVSICKAHEKTPDCKSKLPALLITMSPITALLEKLPLLIAKPILYVFDVLNNIFGRVAFITKGPVKVVFPDTFNVDKHVVALDSNALPEMFNDDKHVVTFNNVEFPETFNDDKHVVAFDKVVYPETFNDE